MRLTFVSNYINHHQIPFSNACYQELEGEYFFIQTEPMEDERIAMGWGKEVGKLSYVRYLYQEAQQCEKLILESDLVVFGWSNEEIWMDGIIQKRMALGKPALRMSERLYKEGRWKFLSPRGLWKKYRQYTRYRKQPMYLLCAGAYVASDFRLIGAYPDKMLRFGYFPETLSYAEGQLEDRKLQDGRVHLLWAGRFIPYKHPEFVINLGEELKQEQEKFHIHMVGGGVLEEQLKAQVKNRGLEEVITFHGFAAPGQVRELMEQCHIYLFTSNQEEGWGAVVNEAMNSGCGIVASQEAGAVPYLIRHGENGLVYHKDSYQEFAGLVKQLVRDRELTARLGQQAYQTIINQWNAEHAAKELIRFGKALLEGQIAPAQEGPLSKAPILIPGKG